MEARMSGRSSRRSIPASALLVTQWWVRTLLALCVLPLIPALAPTATTTPAGADFDALLSPYFKPGEPGAAIIVTKDGKTALRKAYGLANLELNVALKPEMVFRVGSLTKQFTAVAIFMLEEQGKLAIRR